MRIIPFTILILSTVSAMAELPDAPYPMAITVSRPAPARPIKYLSDKVNRDLILAEFTFRVLDAISTEQFMHDPCHCIHERILPQAIVRHPLAMYAYSLGLGAAVSGVSYELWRHNHHKLARIALAVDISDEALADAGNWKLISRGKK